jgi:hypothetical protein
MAHNVGREAKTEPGDLERHLAAELSRQGMSRHETVAITALWLRNIGGKAQVLVEVKTPKRGVGWYLVLEESLNGPFSHIAEVAGILDSPEDPLTTHSAD